MNEIILRWNTWVKEESIDEETGDVIKGGHSEIQHKRFKLSDILEIMTTWNGIHITFVDGTEFNTTDNDVKIFFH